MVRTIKDRDANFFEQIDELLKSREGGQESVTEAVRDIVEAVRERGDEAVVEYTKKFDGFGEHISDFRVREHKLKEASESIPEDAKRALYHAATRIDAFHRHQARSSIIVADEPGVTLGLLIRPLRRVGLYVPGGKATYPSSVLMNAIPAQVAGVEELVMVSPAPKGEVNPLVLAAANMLGIREVWTIGGAQAVAALAYGTESIPRVDKIVGPGNVFVTEAKRQVFGMVDIDKVAGPSEIVIISDGHGEPAWMAADMLSQLEHDEEAMAVLITISSDEADAVSKELDKQLAALPRSEIAGKALENNGAIVIVESLEKAVSLAEHIAPEHLEVATEDPWSLVGGIRNAGAIFLGHNAPEPIGDYLAGPNHVLPTGGTARFASPLNVDDFTKKTSVIQLDDDALQRLGPDAKYLAELEELHAHARAVDIRLK